MLHEIYERVTIPLDIQKSSSWLLFHQALFHTYTHHDADGYSTWTQILENFKIWVSLRPKGFGEFKSRQEFYEASKAYLNPTPGKNGYYGDESERYAIYGGPGDIM
jgi:hypothetical protein